MSGIKKLRRLHETFDSLDSHLRKAIKREQLLSNELVKEHGFLLRTYRLPQTAASEKYLDELQTLLEEVTNREASLLRHLDDYKETVSMIQRQISSLERHEIELVKPFVERLNNAFYQARLAVQQVKKLREDRSKKTLTSVSKMVSQILVFVDFVEEILGRYEANVQEEYFESERTYGRAMSPAEAKKTQKNSVLYGAHTRDQGEPVAVFDCPPSVERRILGMTSDERKNFFGQIGVRGATKVIIFTTDRKPIVEKPIPQKNGLNMYQFPSGLEVSVKQAA